MRSHLSPEKIELSRHLFGKADDVPAFFSLYDDLLRNETDFIVNIDPEDAKPLSEREVILMTSLIKTHPAMTKEDVVKKVKTSFGINRSTEKIDSLINISVQLVSMADCNAGDHHSSDYSLGGFRPISWVHGESFLGFMERSFPMSKDPSIQEKAEAAVDEKAALKAWKLRNRFGIKFRGTHNLSEHLLLDPKSNSLYLFHHVGFLKAQLEKARDEQQPLGQHMEESLKSGNLPPQLLVETLHSLQSILFQSIDRKSADILDDLIGKRRGAFDRECAEYEGYILFHSPPEDFKYVYWAERLSILQDMITSRPPRNKFERWLHRQSNEGSALYVALVALFISILVGIISIGLGAIQVWIAWMAWKYPVPEPSG
ncbi:hypothetical protein CORC01_08511 [Colletotrichum orchidophilum]|uniref:Uncharacterized protein n=1 Tax=Colletotrichum orchidophilum TaxID=1209926 RepID=A0A1G4B413_9PEZI|nr:uncharacterized protein CORC01_08511 [Colletotrichum orchidophilum]OHE96134.1 hypothetical protein CORC01_08511 [Colletotrichum orchidophilum]